MSAVKDYCFLSLSFEEKPPYSCMFFVAYVSVEQRTALLTISILSRCFPSITFNYLSLSGLI